MTRIGTLGANTAYIQRILDIEARQSDEQIQVTTGLKSQSYDGIAADSNALLNFNNEATAANQYVQNNTALLTQLTAASASLDGAQSTIKTFRDQLASFNQGDTTNANSIKQIQTFAFQAMQNLQSYLAANINGQYMFSGGRVDIQPVQLPATTLVGFQSTYDGTNRSWSTTRAAQLDNTPVTNIQSSKLIFNAASGTISAANATALSGIASSASITVTNTVSNNQTFQVYGHALMNTNGTAMTDTASAGAGAVISYGSTPTNIANAATGNLAIGFKPNGNMTITPTTANTLSALTVGTKFTLNGSTGGNWDGAFTVVSNANGVVEFATDTDQNTSESITQTGGAAPLSVTVNGVATPLTAGTTTFTTTPSTVANQTLVTLTGAGATDFAGAAVGNTIQIGGSSDHNGTYTITAKTSNSVTFAINSDALRVSKLIPQTVGRTDATIEWDAGRGTPQSTVTAAGGSVAGYGQLTFSPNGTTGERISGSNGANSFVDASGNPYPPVGQVITMSSTSGVNDGVYTVTANNGNYIEIQSVPRITTNEGVTTGQVSTTSWYQGDTLGIQQRIDDDRQISLGVYASDPAFEKAFRAMGLIAQGVTGTAGGLDKNQQRVSQAMYLLNDSLSATTAQSGVPPFGPEKPGDITSVQQNVGFAQQIITNTNTKHKQFAGFLGTRISGIQNIDKTAAVTQLLSDSNSLQASYQALAKVQSLSLLNYIK